MLTKQQTIGFETFGLLLIRSAFSAQEIERIKIGSDQLWASELATNPKFCDGDCLTSAVERSDQLRWLVEDDRIFLSMQQLLGKDFIWSGSESHRRPADDIDLQRYTDHPWHADRGGDGRELEYTRIKIMLYLQPMRKQTGALRVIPGSHRLPLHSSLCSFEEAHHKNAKPLYFGTTGNDVPSYALETEPGDMIMFNQALYHAVYGKAGQRQYLALKYAAKPTTEHHIESLKQRSSNVFEPDEILRQHPSERIQQMLEGIPQVTL